MFKQFAQFNRNALQGGGGSGLGLWICKNLATYHGGRLVLPPAPVVVFACIQYISINSQGFHSEGAGKGCTFFVDLPIYFSKEPQPPSPPRAEERAINNPRLQRLPYPAHLSLSSEGEKVDDDADEDDRNRAGLLSARATPCIPFSSVLHEDVVAPLDMMNRVPSATHTSRKKILIVDDSSINRCVVMIRPRCTPF